MAEVVDGTPKKAKATKAKKPKTAPTHPKVSEMVTTAITTLKERGGSSLAAIKKYIGASYKVDVEKLSPFIRKYLKSAVVSGVLVQTKGKGANGSFRIGGTSAAVKAKPKTAAKPKKAAVKAAKPKKPKAASPKKKVAKPKKASPKKPKSPAKKAKPAAAKKKPAAKKPKPAKLATKAKKPKASPKKAAAKKGKK